MPLRVFVKTKVVLAPFISLASMSYIFSLATSKGTSVRSDTGVMTLRSSSFPARTSTT